MSTQKAVPLSLLILLGGLTAIAPLSTDMYLPAFPAMRAQLGLAPGDMELSFSAYFVGMLLGMLCYGPVSDRFGRRPPLLFGMALYTVTSLLIAASDSLPELVAWRLLQGLGGCAGTVLTVAIVRDRCPPQQAARVMSLITLVMGLAPILGPLLGGWMLARWAWPAIFLVLAGYGLACLVGLLVLLDESLAQCQERLRVVPVVRGYAKLLVDRRFIGYALSQAGTNGAMMAYIVAAPFVLIDLNGVSPSQFGFYFGANALGLVAASQLSRWLLRTRPAAVLLHRALWLPSLAGALLLLNQLLGMDGLALVLPAFFLLVTSVGLVAPNATAMAMAQQSHQAGQASALHVSLYFGTGMLGSLLVGVFHDGSLWPVTLVIFAVVVMGRLSHLCISRPLERRNRAAEEADVALATESR
ncbi:multidrug effflux MFS transporter [Marinobacterium aestuariivivens]|uniref:Bcr/CflA family efflux transporter n=1 Tax=Marinobacterium aestuariivivens TaxID=1698799 RepID=A0ABW2A2C3_9GAMM